MSNLPPLNMPKGEDVEINLGNDDKAKEKEGVLRKKLLHGIVSGQLKFSRKEVEYQRSIRLAKYVICYLSVFFSKGLHKIDLIGEDVEPTIKDLTEDELLAEDIAWFVGKVAANVPFQGVLGAGGRLGVRVVRHRYGKRIIEAGKKGAKFAKEVRKEVDEKMKEKSTGPVERSVSSSSSVSYTSYDERSSKVFSFYFWKK